MIKCLFGHDWQVVKSYNRVCLKCGKKQMRNPMWSMFSGVEEWINIEDWQAFKSEQKSRDAKALNILNSMK